MSNLKYVIVGAGGTGGVLGAHMAEIGLDVTLIARNQHLQAIQEKGLILEQMWEPQPKTIPIKACSMESYADVPDVIFVCVKGYSLDDAIAFIQKAADAHTVVIPILNVYGTGARMQEQLPDMLVTDGCMYVSANIKEPGVILQHGKILRVVFGVRNQSEYRPVLKDVETELRAAGVDGMLTDQIQRDALVKFSYVSPMGAASLYCDAVARDFQREGAERDMFCAMIREITALGNAMGIQFEEDLVERNLVILEGLPAESTTSMQRDVLAGRNSEMDGLIFEPVRMGARYGVDMPEYTKVAAKFGFTL